MKKLLYFRSVISIIKFETWCAAFEDLLVYFVLSDRVYLSFKQFYRFCTNYNWMLCCFFFSPQPIISIFHGFSWRFWYKHNPSSTKEKVENYIISSATPLQRRWVMGHWMDGYWIHFLRMNEMMILHQYRTRWAWIGKRVLCRCNWQTKWVMRHFLWQVGWSWS